MKVDKSIGKTLYEFDREGNLLKIFGKITAINPLNHSPIINGSYAQLCDSKNKLYFAKK